MRRTPLLSLSLAALAFAGDVHAQTADARSAAVAVAGPGAKVTAPVEVEIVPQADPAPGRRRVRIVARPSVDAASLTLEVAGEDGLALAPGAEATWTGPARAEQEVVRELDFIAAGPGELRVVVTATVKYGDDVTQSGIHEYALNPTAAVRSAGLPKSFRAPATDPGGRTVIEVPAKTP